MLETHSLLKGAVVSPGKSFPIGATVYPSGVKPGLEPWRCWLDTFLEPPADICLFSDASPVAGTSYLVHPRSIVALARVAD